MILISIVALIRASPQLSTPGNGWLKPITPGRIETLCGIRTGTHPGEGQGYDENQYIAFSKLNEQYFNSARRKQTSAYFIK